MKQIGIVMVLCVVTSSAGAVECQSSPGKTGGHWTWRMNIEPKPSQRCWYQGRKALPRAQLHWPRPRLDYAPRTQAPPPRADSPIPSLQTKDKEGTAMASTASGSIWDCCGLPPAPLLPSPVEPFADRWNDTQSRLLLWNGKGQGQ